MYEEVLTKSVDSEAQSKYSPFVQPYHLIAEPR
jgi:hypothetical protein